MVALASQKCGALVQALNDSGGGFSARGSGKDRVTHGADAGFHVHGLQVNVARPRAVGGAGKFERARFRPLGRVEPAFAQLVQLLRGGGDRGFLRRRRERKGKSVKAGCRRVTRAGFKPRALLQ